MLGRISILLQCKEWHWSIFSANLPLLYQFCFLLPPRGLILATGFSVSCHPLYIFFFLPVCLLPAVLLCSTKSVLHSLGIPDPLLTNRGRHSWILQVLFSILALVPCFLSSVSKVPLVLVSLCRQVGFCLSSLILPGGQAHVPSFWQTALVKLVSSPVSF